MDKRLINIQSHCGWYLFYHHTLAIILFILSALPLSAQLEISIEGQNPTCYNFTNGSVFATVENGVQPFEVLWSTGDSALGVFGLGDGTYSVTIVDGNGATGEASINLVQPDSLIANIEFVESICTASGYVEVVVSGGTPPYSFNWQSGDTTQVVENLPPGLHCVTTTDSLNCQVVDCIVIPEPLELNISSTPALCPGECNGSLVASYTGGQGPYEVEWSNGIDTEINTFLCEGTYSVTLTDGNGCTLVSSADVNSNLALEIDYELILPECESTGSIVATASGGVGPYNYAWSNFQVGNLLVGVFNGSYGLTVTDFNGCVFSDTIELYGDTDLVVESDLSFECGQTSGFATAFAGGGEPPYAFAWSDGQTGQVAQGLFPNVLYQVTVVDDAGCAAVDAILFTESSSFIVNTNSAPPSCFGESDGIITTEVSDTEADYSYKWSTGDTASELENLPAGLYTVTVEQVNGCEVVETIILEDPPLLNTYIDVRNLNSGPQTADGSLAVVIEGGTPGYTIEWNNGATDLLLEDLLPGFYAVTVTDFNGCVSESSLSLGEGGVLGDFIWRDNNNNGLQDIGEPGVPNVQVVLSGTDDNGNEVETSTFSDQAGFYDIQIFPGTYQLQFIAPSGLAFTEGYVGLDGALDSDVNADGFSNEFELKAGEVFVDFDAGLIEGCENIARAGAILGDQELCGPGQETIKLTNDTFPSGANGFVEYAWFTAKTDSPFNEEEWEIVPNSNFVEWDPGLVNETTFYRRGARVQGCSDWKTSNAVKIEVDSVAIAAIDVEGTVFCVNDQVEFSAFSSGNGAAYFWDFGVNAIDHPSIDGNPVVSWAIPGTYIVRLEVSRDGCISVDEVQIDVRWDEVVCKPGIALFAIPIQEGLVQLDWEIAEELDNFTYALERSYDGVEYERIAEDVQLVSSTGGSNQYQHYDTDPGFGKIFYRVELTGPEGRILYSAQIDLLLKPENDLVKLYPNPFYQILTIETLEANRFPFVELHFFNAQGRRVKKTIIQNGVLIREVDYSPLPSGLYFIQVWYEDEELQVIKVVKG